MAEDYFREPVYNNLRDLDADDFPDKVQANKPQHVLVIAENGTRVPDVISCIPYHIPQPPESLSYTALGPIRCCAKIVLLSNFSILDEWNGDEWQHSQY